MPDTKITALAAITTVAPSNDLFPIVDVSDNSMAASGTTKNITVNQLLGAGGIAALSSATITGDLTVDTSTLKVDSANDRVGVGTASPAQFVHFSKSNTSTALTAPPVGGASLRIQNTSSTNNNFCSVEFYNAAGLFGASVNCQYTNQTTPTNDLVFVTRGSSGGLEHYRIAADGVCTWSEVGGVAGTAMTLNSTGLGLGQSSPFSKLHIQGASQAGCSMTMFYTGLQTATIGIKSNGSLTLGLDGGTGTTDRLLIDTSGNVGIGVTPVTGGKLTVAGPIVRNKGNATLTQNVATTVATLPGEGLFIAYAYTNASNPSAFTSYAVILCDSVGSRVIANNGTQISITTSTFALQVTQIFAATLGVSWSFVQIG